MTKLINERGRIMGHDISGYNKQEEQIAYARYSMNNNSARTLYEVLEVYDFDGGVSGIGAQEKFNAERIKQAIENFKNIDWADFEDGAYEKEKLETFLNNCLKTAQEEGEVTISFA